MSNQDYNKDVLIRDLALIQWRRTSLYYRDNILVFSPVVGQNTQGYYWFDIRQANLQRRDKISPAKIILLARVVPNIFVLAEFDKMQSMINVVIPKRKDKAGSIWGFIIDLKAHIIKSKDNTSFYKDCLINDRPGIVSAFQGMTDTIGAGNALPCI